MSNAWKFAVVFLVVNLHLLRNVSAGAYLVIYLLVTFPVVVSFLAGRQRRRVATGVASFWFAAALYGLLVSAAFIPVSGAAYGLLRFAFAFPVFMAFVQFTESAEDLRKHIRTMVAFFALAAATVPLQFATGPIPFFVSESERGGFERYGSLTGSLTSLGIAAGCYIVLLPLAGRGKSFAASSIVLGAFASLSKAAVVNVAMGALISLYTHRHTLGRGLLGLFAAATVSLLAIAFVPQVSARLDATLQSFGRTAQAGETRNYDESVQESAIDRLTTLPLENLAVLDHLETPLVHLTGAGFGMASTALVPESSSLAPMAHNQYVELYSVFGIVVGFGLILSLLIVLRRLHVRGRESRICAVVFGSMAVFLANGFFANGTVYQPATASILWLAVYCAGAPNAVVNTEQVNHPSGPTLVGHPRGGALGSAEPWRGSQRARRTPGWGG